MPGEKVDGHEFAAAAVEAGAVALVVERELELDVAQVVVADARAAMAPLAARFWGDPTAELRVVGVTGTNGKTTTAFLIREMLEAAGVQCGLLGTVRQVVGGVEEEVERTTPEAIDLQATFRRMLEAGDRACVMEVSSHALALHRADAIHFEVALFTNLTQDHLDFHGDMEEYFRAKRLLFEMGPKASIVNVDDPYGRRLAEEFDCVTFSAEGADGRLRRPRRLLRRRPAPRFGRRRGRSRCGRALPGHFNVANALGAFAAATALGVAPGGRGRGAGAGRAGAGAVRAGRRGAGLRRAGRLRAHARLAGERAAGGAAADRGAADRGLRRRRRPRPRQAAEDGPGRAPRSPTWRSSPPTTRAPRTPRRSSPRSSPGSRTAPRSRSSPTAAPRSRWRSARARPGDTVVIAGKGHEQGQEFEDGRKVPFDDREVAREELRKLVERG